MINSKGLQKFKSLVLMAVLAISCNVKESNDESQKKAVPIEGTWELISETKIEKEDTIYTPASSKQRMIKILNKTHFAFLRHDLTQGKDSALFVAGGGRYFLKDRQYEEKLEYCNFREWENNNFQFTVDIQNDTLIQKGIEKLEDLGIDRIIIEKYKRVQE